MSLRALFVFGALVLGTLSLAACVPGDRGAQRPPPSEPATGTVLDMVESGDTTFIMYDEGGGCLAVEVRHPGLQSTVDRGCFDHFNTLRWTSSCGWLAEQPQDGALAGATGDEYGCDVSLPRVFYGRVTDSAVGYVCVGTFNFEGGGDTGVVGARLIDRDADGYIFTVAGDGEQGPPHFLSPGGSRIGDPPLDAPSGPIYRLCEAQASVAARELIYGVDLIVEFDHELRGREVTVFFLAGLDRLGVPATAAGDEPAVVPVRITPNLLDFEAEVEIDSEPPMTTRLQWPQEIRDIVLSGEACDGLTRAAVRVGARILDGDSGALGIRFLSSECDVAPLTSTDEPPPVEG